jgi:two-component system, cell cycle response regulator
MVVDAIAADMEQARGILALFNYQVLAIATPEEALAAAASPPVDCVLMSLEMPGGGFELSMKLRSFEPFKDIPVAFSTSTNYDSAVLMEAQFYNGLFLHKKPYVESELLAQVSTMVRIKQLQDELKDRMLELDRLASTDPLTGLYNRRFFFQRMEEELARVNRNQSPICLMFLDIDHFKLINDTHGHQAGDTILQQCSQIMTHLLRRSDVLGRIGGEEFLILLPDTDGKGGVRIAERLRQRIENASFMYGDVQIPVTVSLGVYYSTDPLVLGVDELVQRADAALYEAKESGRNRIAYHTQQPLAAAPPAEHS